MSLLPATPRLSTLDARAFVKPLRDKLRKDDGSAYAAYGETVFPGFVGSLRTLRDHVAKVTTFANDVKRNVDRHGATLIAHDTRLDRHTAEIAELKAAEPPFPMP
jgi:hypothetical protein